MSGKKGLFPPALKGATSPERGPTTTEHDGTGGPSFSSKWGAQAPRHAWAQTLSWICNKFIPEPTDGRKQELETSCKNAQIWEGGSCSRSELGPAEGVPCAWVTLDPASQPVASRAPGNTGPAPLPLLPNTSPTAQTPRLPGKLLLPDLAATWPGEGNMLTRNCSVSPEVQAVSSEVAHC